MAAPRWLRARSLSTCLVVTAAVAAPTATGPAASGGSSGSGGGSGGASATAAAGDADEMKALITRWQKAQNDRKVDDYLALYARDFQGVRRSGKTTVRLDLAGW